MIRRLKLQYVAGLFLFFAGPQIFAQTYRLEGVHYVHKSLDEVNEGTNQLGPLYEGSEIKVLQTVPARGNKKILQIEVTKLDSEHRRSALPKGKFWIYNGNDDDFVEVASSKRKNTQAGCKNCLEKPVTNPSPQLTNNSENVADIAGFIEHGKHQPEVVEKPTPQVANEAPTGNLAEMIKRYSNSSQVAAMIARAKHPPKYGRKRVCYKPVKLALATKDAHGSSLIPTRYYDDEAAINAVNTLQDKKLKHSFVNLLDDKFKPDNQYLFDPLKAPKGAILVYSSGIPCAHSRIKDCGHIEIATGDIDPKTGGPGKDAFVHQLKSNNPITLQRWGYKYKLIGVMIKPMENE